MKKKKKKKNKKKKYLKVYPTSREPYGWIEFEGQR